PPLLPHAEEIPHLFHEERLRGARHGGRVRDDDPVCQPLVAMGSGVLYGGSMELSMPIEEAMRTQRAIRRLKTDPVDDALVLHLIELALKAPTGSNAQSWEFVVVRDRAVKERLGTLNRRAWTLYGGLGRRLYGSDPQMARILDAVQWQADHFAEIPVLV